MRKIWFLGTTASWFFGAFVLQLTLRLQPGQAIVQSFAVGVVALLVVLAVENWPWRA